MITFLSSNLLFIVIGAIIMVGLLFLLRFLFPKLKDAELRKAEITISPSSGLGLKIETFAQENSVLSIGIAHAMSVPISPDIQRLLNLMVRYDDSGLVSESCSLPFRGNYATLRVLEKTSTYPLDIYAIMDMIVARKSGGYYSSSESVVSQKKVFITCERLGLISQDRDCEIEEKQKVYLEHLASQLNKLSAGTSSDDMAFVVIFFGARRTNYNVDHFLSGKFSNAIKIYFEDSIESDEQKFQAAINNLFLYKEVGKLSEFASEVDKKSKRKRA